MISKYLPPVEFTHVQWLMLALLGLTMGCAGSYDPNIERGSDYQYREGHPEFRISTIGFFDENDQPTIRIDADLVYGSLIYRSPGDSLFRARVMAEIQLLNQDNPEETVETQQFDLDITSPHRTVVNSQDVYNIRRTIKVPPGDYLIRMVLTDNDSGKQTVRESRAYLPDNQQKMPNLTNIQMQGKDVEADNKFQPITTYDVPSRIDSLKFLFQVTNNVPDRRVVIQSQLIRFDADSTPARPMSYSDYSPSSIQYKGIEYDDETEIQSSRRVITQEGNILIEFVLPTMDRGNYRFQAKISNIDATDEEVETNLFKARDFSVKSPNYPAVKSPRELAAPLIYLMKEKEYEKMMAHSNPNKIKEAIDRFWLTNLEDKQMARTVIKKYYERVEQANKQFSNFEEGWKTDPGMIYILFGPPWYIEERVDIMQWSYAYDRQNPNYNFVFRRNKMETKFYPFRNYILQRNNYYYQVEYQQRQRWLTGQILKRDV
ncbi:MAG: GWxTD domain-containing protein [Bacteroidota bacterium]